MRTGGDPDEIRRLAARGGGQAFDLDRTARRLDAAGRWYRWRSDRPRVEVGPAADGMLRLAGEVAWLARWTRAVADALARADAAGAGAVGAVAVDPRHVRLVELGPASPLARLLPQLGAAAGAVTRADWATVPLAALDGDELRELERWPDLPPSVRDRVVRLLVADAVQRLLAPVPSPTASVPARVLDRVAGWIDDHLLDRADAVLELSRTPAERRDRDLRLAAGLRWLAAQPDLTLLAFAADGGDPDGTPVLRVALGDPTTAEVTVVLLAGTGSGVATPARTVTTARALHAAASTAAGDGAAVATVVELYGAPRDVGHAVDPRYGEVAAARLAAYLTTTGTAPAGRVAVVGHSYGAFAAGRTMVAGAGATTDTLVLLGAPGAGVLHVRELGLGPDATVWVGRTPDDPIRLAADADELLAGFAAATDTDLGPLAAPLVVLGPDPADPAFGASSLPLGTARGHGSYLDPEADALANVARVAVGAAPLP